MLCKAQTHGQHWPSLCHAVALHTEHIDREIQTKKKPLKFGIDQKKNLKTWFMKHYQVYDTELIHIT